MFGIFIGAGIFFGIMIPTILVSVLPGVTIKILEFLRVYKKGNVYSDVSDYITGAGLHRTGKVYMGTDKNGGTSFVNTKVFGYLVLVFLPLSLLINILVYFIIR
jgi:hypothetical protein